MAKWVPGRRRNADPVEQVFSNGLAERASVSHDWERARGLRSDNLQKIYQLMMGEIVEFLEAQAQPRPAESHKNPQDTSTLLLNAEALLEFGDIMAFFLKLPLLVLDQSQLEITPLVQQTQPRLETTLAQAMLAAPDSSLPSQNHGTVNDVFDLMAYVTEAHAGLVGIAVSRPKLRAARDQALTILGQPASYVSTSHGPQLSKPAEKRIIRLFSSAMSEPLPTSLHAREAVAVLPEMEQVLTIMADSTFQYPYVADLAAAFFSPWGKNARNHPPGQPKGALRSLRNQFYSSIIPAEYKVGGSETPQEFYHRQYPGLSPQEVHLRVLQAELPSFEAAPTVR